jgi:hypothetical protein
MNLLRIQFRIATLLTTFVESVKVLNAMERYDINRISQIILVPLFREVYDLPGLRNLDDEWPNHPSVDLGDDSARVAFQVTSSADTGKIKECLSTFMRRKLYEKYDQVFVYSLTEKKRRYTSQSFERITKGKVIFDKDIHILDYKDIAKTVTRFHIDKAERVLEILEQNFGQQRARAQVEIKKAKGYLGWYEVRDSRFEKEGPARDHFNIDACISFTAADVTQVILHAERCRAVLTREDESSTPILIRDFKMFALPRPDGNDHYAQLTFSGKKSFCLFDKPRIIDEEVADRLREKVDELRLHIEVKPIGSEEFVTSSVPLSLENPIDKEEVRFWVHWCYIADDEK